MNASKPPSPASVPAVHDFGGSGEPLLICHATGFNGPAYRPLAAALTARHRVFAVDLRGHGLTPLPDGASLSWLDMAEDVVAAVKELGEAPHLFGHSVGGATGLYAEASNPGLFRSAFVFEPPVVPPGFNFAENSDSIERARRRRETFPSAAEALYRFGSRPPLDCLNAAALAGYVEGGFEEQADGTVRLRCRSETEARIYEATAEMTFDHLADVTIPTVVATGETSTPEIITWMDELAARIPAARRLVLPNLGHLGPLEHPRTVAVELLRHTAAGARG